MKISELKRGEMLRNVKTGEVCKVSKRWDGVYLIDPETKKGRFKPDPFNEDVEMTSWERVA